MELVFLVYLLSILYFSFFIVDSSHIFSTFAVKNFFLMSLIYWIKFFWHFHRFYFVILFVILHSFITHFNMRYLWRVRISLSYCHINLIINLILAIWIINISNFEWRLHFACNKISAIKTLFGTWTVCWAAWYLMIYLAHLNSSFLNYWLSYR